MSQVYHHFSTTLATLNHSAITIWGIGIVGLKMQITSLLYCLFDQYSAHKISFSMQGDKNLGPDGSTQVGNSIQSLSQTGDVAFQPIMKDLIVRRWLQSTLAQQANAVWLCSPTSYRKCQILVNQSLRLATIFIF